MKYHYHFKIIKHRLKYLFFINFTINFIIIFLNHIIFKIIKFHHLIIITLFKCITNVIIYFQFNNITSKQ